MNQAEFAKLHGVSRKTVTMWKSRGWLVLEGDEVNVEASNANIEMHRKTVTPPEKKKKLSGTLVTLTIQIRVTGPVDLEVVTATAETTKPAS